MKRVIKSLGRGRIAFAAFAFSGMSLLALDPAIAQGCDGGPLSTSSGNLIGSVIGGAAGGLLGNQIGHGSGKGVATGLGVVGGALAGGYVGRSSEGCHSTLQQASQPSAYHAVRAQPAHHEPTAASETRTCRYVLTQAEIDGREQRVNGIACLDPDGTWKIASGPSAHRAADADLVLRAQQQLHQQGFYVRDNVDGEWGPATSSAVRNFQRANGLALTGQLDAPTQAALGLVAEPVAAAPVAVSGQGGQFAAPVPAAEAPAMASGASSGN